VKRLLGRLVFRHFLQKKGWMGCPKKVALASAERKRTDSPKGETTLPWAGGDPDFLASYFKTAAEHFRALLEFFDQYHFTIDENEPEMLGHIFENLLEDNKDKGAYYTPIASRCACKPLIPSSVRCNATPSHESIPRPANSPTKPATRTLSDADDGNGGAFQSSTKKPCSSSLTPARFTTLSLPGIKPLMRTPWSVASRFKPGNSRPCEPAFLPS